MGRERPRLIHGTWLPSIQLGFRKALVAHDEVDDGTTTHHTSSNHPHGSWLCWLRRMGFKGTPKATTRDYKNEWNWIHFRLTNSNLIRFFLVSYFIWPQKEKLFSKNECFKNISQCLCVCVWLCVCVPQNVSLYIKKRTFGFLGISIWLYYLRRYHHHTTTTTLICRICRTKQNKYQNWKQPMAMCQGWICGDRVRV